MNRDGLASTDVKVMQVYLPDMARKEKKDNRELTVFQVNARIPVSITNLKAAYAQMPRFYKWTLILPLFYLFFRVHRCIRWDHVTRLLCDWVQDVHDCSPLPARRSTTLFGQPHHAVCRSDRHSRPQIHHVWLCRSATYHVITRWPLVHCGCSARLEQAAVATSSCWFRLHFQTSTEYSSLCPGFLAFWIF